jgi:thiol-disulfide isomerase/thioredoxin
MKNRVIVISATILVAVLFSVFSDKLLKSNLGSGQVRLKSLPLELRFITQPEDKVLVNEKIKAKSRPFYIHFWATWCAPCEVELPELLELSSKLPGFDFYLVAVNDDWSKINKSLSKYKNNWPKNAYVYLDNINEHLDKFGTARVPETFVFNSNLEYLKKYIGPQTWTNPRFLEQANSFLK